MHLIADGERSKQWFAFAKKKLAQLKQTTLSIKTMVINGYRIQLAADWDKVKITAPPAVVVTHTEYPPDYDPVTNPGRERVYYADCYGMPALLVGQTGGAGAVAYPVFKTFVDVGGTLYQYMPGYGVIFPTLSDFYRASVGFTYQPYWAVTYVGYVIWGSQMRYANVAAKPLFNVVGDTYSLQNIAWGGWQVSAGSFVWTVSGNPSYTSADPPNNALEIFAIGNGPRAYLHLDMSAIRALLGNPLYPWPDWLYGFYFYPYAGKVRLVLFYTTGGNTSGDSDAAKGAYFFDMTRIEVPDGIPTLDIVYVGKCLSVTTGLMHGGAPSTLIETAVIHKSCPFADGAGGVYVTIREATTYTDRFVPSGACSSDGGRGFPPEITDAQTWPTIFNGTDTELCIMEQIADAACTVTGLYYHTTSWDAIPMPTEILLTVRPVHVSLERIVLVALAWDAALPGTVFMQFDNIDPMAEPWRKFGKVADIRMTRPSVGFFGAHEYTALAMNLPGVFPVTTRTATHQYTGV